MKTKWWVGLLAAMIAAGCVPSLHPWFTDKDVVFEEKLLGVWEQENEDTLWIFKKGEVEKTYRLTIATKDEESARLVAVLFKIDGTMYLDTTLDGNPLENTHDFFQAHIIGVHQIFRIDSIHPTVQFRMLNPDTITKMFKAKPDLLANESFGDGPGLLTASTEKLRIFIAEHTNDEKFFTDPSNLIRRNPLFDEKDFGFEPKLAGRWIDDDGSIYISHAVNNQGYRVLAIRSKDEGPEISRYSSAVVTINQRRFVAVYEEREVDINGGTDADRTADLLLWIEQVDPTPVYRVIDYSDAAEIVKMNDESFKQAVEKLPKFRWNRLESVDKK